MKPNNLRIYLINGRQETAGPHRTVDHWIAVDTHNEIMTLEAILCQITNAAVAVTWKRHNIGGARIKWYRKQPLSNSRQLPCSQ